ncbi:MAG TPA: TonB-dependent receptor [Chitinophagaceae bacterium]
MIRIFIVVIFTCAALSSFAQRQFTISGIIKDGSTGETLIGATARLKEIRHSGALANNYGFYSLSAPPGNYTIIVSFAGYEIFQQQVAFNKSLNLDISLSEKNLLQEVVVGSKRPNNGQIVSPQMGVEKLNMSQINTVPVLFGEKDILKTISLLPGVQAAGEGNTGFFVRGGGADQNLILLDEATVYNASHLLGFFSTFNSDAIKDISLYKGGMPAEFGGRLSSVLDVKMLDGNNKKFDVEGGLGLISSRIKAEGPIKKDKGSFLVSARRTYIDLFTKVSKDSLVKGSSLYFYDINVKGNYHFDNKNALFISGYFGHDVIGLKNTFGTNWGNATGTLRFNHIFTNKLFSNTSLIFSNYHYDVESFLTNDDFQSASKITDINLKEDLQYSASDAHTLKFGLNILRHAIAPGDITSSATSSINNTSVERRYGFENAAYISDNWKASDKLTILYGLRLSGVALLGPGTFSTYDPNGNTTSSAPYSSGSLVKNYVNLEPRFSASYQLNEENSIKTSYNRNTQNIHLLNNSTSSTPTDLYVLSSNNIRPEIADQISAGWFKNLHDNLFEFSAEVYYKWLQNQIDYKDGANLVANQNVESQLTFGSGRAYGLELYLKKKYGRFNGWLSYTLSRTEDRFAAIDNNKYFPASQDHTHNVSGVGIYKLSRRWTLSGTFIYNTGNAVSYPTGKYNTGGLTAFSYSERNGYREPANHRLDLGATLEGREHKKYHTSWTFSIYNVYAHWDPYSITFRDSKTIANTTEPVETSLFPKPVPSISWNFKF